jgi:hypothetical protein
MRYNRVTARSPCLGFPRSRTLIFCQRGSLGPGFRRVMAFFWKGDEALSDDFKKWLSQKVMGIQLTVPDMASIEPLGRIFDSIYGRRYFTPTTFLRVAAVSLLVHLPPRRTVPTEPRSSTW